jgi:thiol-disulfide isomerase/thioredoxin
MILRKIQICVIIVGWFLTSACTRGNNDQTRTVPADKLPKIEVINEAGFNKLIQERDGKILLLNFWATWCIPCRDEFPDLVKVANRYHDQSVEVVGISADYPDEIESKVEPFLKSQNANFKNYVKDVEDDEAFINLVNREWSGALPATFVYDVSGVLRDSQFGQNDFPGFQKMIEQVRQSEVE